MTAGRDTQTVGLAMGALWWSRWRHCYCELQKATSALPVSNSLLAEVVTARSLLSDRVVRANAARCTRRRMGACLAYNSRVLDTSIEIVSVKPVGA